MTRLNRDQMFERILKSVAENRPFSLIRMGDGENVVLSGEIFKFYEWSYPGENRCIQGSYEYLRSGMVEAVKNCDLAGIFLGDTWTYDALAKAGAINPEFQAYAFCNLFMAGFKPFVDNIMRNKKLLLIGSSMGEYNDLLKSKIPEARTIAIYKDMVIRSKVHCDELYQKIDACLGDFEVALVSMGVWALPICDYLKKKGKIAIDYGHAASHQLIGEYEINLQYDDMDDYFKNSKCPICWK